MVLCSSLLLTPNCWELEFLKLKILGNMFILILLIYEASFKSIFYSPGRLSLIFCSFEPTVCQFRPISFPNIDYIGKCLLYLVSAPVAGLNYHGHI